MEKGLAVIGHNGRNDDPFFILNVSFANSIANILTIGKSVCD